MSGPSFPTKLKIALVAQAVFALGLIFYVSQTLLRHLQFGVPQPIADYFVQLIAIIVPPAMLLLSLLALRSPRRAIRGPSLLSCSCRWLPRGSWYRSSYAWLVVRTPVGSDAF